MTAPLSGISPAVGAALSGIRGSIERFNTASAQVSRAAAEAAGEIGAGGDTATFSDAALAKVQGAASPDAALEQGMIDQRLAVHDLTANIRVIQTADEMTKSLMHILPPR